MIESAAEDDEELVELEIVGEGRRQDTLAAIAGPKEVDGKSERVGVTLRCEPDDQYDADAMRVEVMGQLVAYVQRDLAARVVPTRHARSVGGAARAAAKRATHRFAPAEVLRQLEVLPRSERKNPTQTDD